LRAIEQGLPLVRVANTGISGMIDAKGRVTARMGLGVEGARDAALPTALPPTVYARLGDWPVVIMLFALAVAVFRQPLRDYG
jgi:apolipoprotein N-acyltransferase